MDLIDLVQWPAMVITIAAAWFTAAQTKHQRKLGFWLFLLSNAMWIVWGWSTAAWALVVLQVGLATMNIRGSLKNDDEGEAGDENAAAAGSNEARA
ncbi:MAG: hypothetical protein ABIN96_01240 [Rubrivivax sp.]